MDDLARALLLFLVLLPGNKINFLESWIIFLDIEILD